MVTFPRDDPYSDVKKKAVQPLANNGGGNDFLQGLGGFLSDSGKNIGNFLAEMERQAGEGLKRKEANRQKRKYVQPEQVERRKPNVSWDIGSDIHNKRESDMLGPVGEIEEEESMTDKLMRLLDEKYSGSPVGEDDILEKVLNSKLEAIEGARGQARSAFETSDKNVAGMHDAFRNEILGQAPALQQRNQEHQGNVASIFDQAIGQNDTRAAENKARDEEMFQRLGIAPAAAAPDLVGQAIAEGNNRLTGSKTSRLGEAATLGQVDLQRNTGMANAVGNDGLARRSELNSRLQEIMGDLGSAESEARTDILGRQNDQAKETEQRQYERFLTDRDFNMDRYGMMNDLNAEAIKQQQKESEQGAEGIDALIATTNPQVVQGVQDIMATEQDVDMNNPADVLYRLRKKGLNLNPTEVQVYLTKMKNLSKTNNVVPSYGE